MEANDAMKALLARLGAPGTKRAVASGQLRNLYQESLCQDDPVVSLDSQEASELVDVEQAREQRAAFTWARLSQREKEAVKKLVQDEDGDPDELEEEMELRA